MNENTRMSNPALLFPTAELLFGGYFHQDFEGTPENVVKAFLKDQPPEKWEQASIEIERMLRVYPDDRALERIVNEEFGNCFDVLRFKTSYREWLREIVEIIRSGTPLSGG